jgi:hypothetical protein
VLGPVEWLAVFGDASVAIGQKVSGEADFVEDGEDFVPVGWGLG